jgi:hypothetical protein
MKPITKFPLPYSSLSSIYLGISDKSHGWINIYPHSKLLQSDLSNILLGSWKWEFKHTSLVMPNLESYTDKQTYKLFLRLRLKITNIEKPFSIKPVQYIEDLTIEHLLGDVYHFSIHSIEQLDNKDIKDIKDNDSKDKNKLLIKKSYKWIRSDDIHHLIL